MKYQTILAGVCLPTMAFAFPGMMPGQSKEEMLRVLQERNAPQELKDRGLISSVVGGVTSTLSTLVDDVNGLLGRWTLIFNRLSIIGSVAASVDPDNARPQPGYEFQEPGPDDSRGPCPGLNLLANYGYLPRDGHVTLAEVVNATAVGFNMGAGKNQFLSFRFLLSKACAPIHSSLLLFGSWTPDL